jgi:hypothetical protein
LALQGNKTPGYEALNPYEWNGRWALISQDDCAISESSKIVIIPFDTGEISIKASSKPKSVSVVGLTGESAAKNWTWKQGRLTIKINEIQLNHTAGYVVEF